MVLRTSDTSSTDTIEFESLPVDTPRLIRTVTDKKATFVTPTEDSVLLKASNVLSVTRDQLFKVSTHKAEKALEWLKLPGVGTAIDVLRVGGNAQAFLRAKTKDAPETTTDERRLFPIGIATLRMFAAMDEKVFTDGMEKSDRKNVSKLLKDVPSDKEADTSKFVIDTTGFEVVKKPGYKTFARADACKAAKREREELIEMAIATKRMFGVTALGEGDVVAVKINGLVDVSLDAKNGIITGRRTDGGASSDVVEEEEDDSEA